MADRIIDLRKKEELESSQPAHSLRERQFTIGWSAREHDAVFRPTSWYLAFGILTLALVTAGILMRSYFFVGLLSLSYVLFMMYEKKMPPELHFAITSEGVKAGRSFFKFSDLESFWIMPEANELSLETKKSLSPFVRLPLRNADAEQVRNFLRNFLEEKEHKDFISDQIARNL